MYRESKEAHELEDAVGDEKITRRRLERWDQDGLFPPNYKEVPREQLVEHIKALADVAKGGPKKGWQDWVAITMAGRGHGCERYKEALVRAYGANSTTELAARVKEDMKPIDPNSDEGTWIIDQIAKKTELALDNEIGPPVVVKQMNELSTRIEEEAKDHPIVDPISKEEEESRDTVHSANSQALMIIYGGSRTSAAIDFVDGDKGNPNWERPFTNTEVPLASVINRILCNLDSVPLARLMRGARSTREIFSWYRPPGFDKDQQDYFAGFMAPTGLAIMGVLAWSNGYRTIDEVPFEVE